MRACVRVCVCVCVCVCVRARACICVDLHSELFLTSACCLGDDLHSLFSPILIDISHIAWMAWQQRRICCKRLYRRQKKNGHKGSSTFSRERRVIWNKLLRSMYIYDWLKQFLVDGKIFKTFSGGTKLTLCTVSAKTSLIFQIETTYSCKNFEIFIQIHNGCAFLDDLETDFGPRRTTIEQSQTTFWQKKVGLRNALEQLMSKLIIIASLALTVYEKKKKKEPNKAKIF